MDINYIKELIESLKETGWKKLEIEDNGFHLKIDREQNAPEAVKYVVQEMPEAVIPKQPDDVAAASTPGGKDITSPLVGIFHHMDGKNKVQVGQIYEKGQPVCLIEAMKLMNEITMPEDGEITYIAVQDSDSVEYGQVLIQYRPM